MQAYVESIFHCNGLPCVVVFRSLGYRCGYVGVPKDHDCYLKDDNELDIDCHWGLTYSGSSIPGVSTTDLGEYWWLGFDCSHAGDARDYNALRKYFKDNKEVMEAADRWENLDKKYPEFDSTIKDLDFAIDQCESIAEQLGKPVPKQTYFEWFKSLDIEALTKELTDMCIQCVEATTGYKYTDEDRKVVYEQNLATMKMEKE